MIMRHPTSKKPILNTPLCVDDFGTLVFQCQYTDAPVWVDTAIFLGPCVPQVHGTYVCSPTAHKAFRESKQIFDECEANCNTCKRLVRSKHAPRKDQQLVGSCHKRVEFLFHPEDYMGMDCYESRST